MTLLHLEVQITLHSCAGLACGWTTKELRELSADGCRWSALMHWILAITNSCNGLTYVTRFSCDIFGFYVAFIYLQKGIQVLTRQWELTGDTSAFLFTLGTWRVSNFRPFLPAQLSFLHRIEVGSSVSGTSGSGTSLLQFLSLSY